MNDETRPRRAVIYVRLSDARNGDSIADQEQRCRKRAAELGWEVVRVFVENDQAKDGRSLASAFKRRKIAVPGKDRPVLRVVRPAWREMLDYLDGGQADALIALDLDRAARDPRDLEDLIDVVEASSPRLPVESVTGSLRLANDADVTMARVMVAVGNKSSRDTARRVAAARERDAAKGKYGGGRRPFGYEADGVTVRECEAAEVRKAAEATLSQVSLREVTASLREREVPTVTGAQWSTGAIRDILRRPRNAGLAVYRGTVVSQDAWPPILDEATWRGVCAILEDPARRTTPGNAPRWLGSLLYQCGACDDGTTVAIGLGSRRTSGPRYACKVASHLSRSAIPTDELVSRTIIHRLARPDAADLLATPPAAKADIADLQRQVTALRARKTGLARMYAAGAIDDAQLTAGSAELGRELSKAEADLHAVSARDPLAGLAGREDAAQVWAGLPLGTKRAIVRLLADVTLLAGRKGGRLPGGSYFDPDSVRIKWRGAAA